MPRERSASADPREEVVHGALHDRDDGRDLALREHLHRDVLHLHLLLGVQDLLCLRLHVASVRHSSGGHGMETDLETF